MQDSTIKHISSETWLQGFGASDFIGRLECLGLWNWGRPTLHKPSHFCYMRNKSTVHKACKLGRSCGPRTGEALTAVCHRFQQACQQKWTFLV